VTKEVFLGVQGVSPGHKTDHMVRSSAQEGGRQEEGSEGKG